MDFITTIFLTKTPKASLGLFGTAILLVVFVSAADLSARQHETVIASANGEPITAGQVARDLARTVGKIKLSPEVMARAKSVSLEKLINQKVVLDFLREHKLASGENEVRLEIEKLERKLATVEKTIDDYLPQTQQTLEDLQFKFAWQLSWKRYLDQMLTDELLESHFKKNNRKFDGTELRVAHLLLKSKPAQDSSIEKQTAELQKKAIQIKSRIDSLELTWTQAVAQNSDAPTRDSGGEIGWIKLAGPMPTSFTNAAFQLSAGEISDPVHTKFGCHIIRCVEVKAGKLGWRDRVDEVKKSATRELFDAVVAKHRPNMKIEYNVEPAKSTRSPQPN